MKGSSRIKTIFLGSFIALCCACILVIHISYVKHKLVVWERGKPYIIKGRIRPELLFNS